MRRISGNPVSGIVVTCVAAVGLAITLGAAGQQQSQRQATVGSGEEERMERLERVGATMWRVRPDDTPYDKWFEGAKAKMPSFEGLLIDDVRTVVLKPWPDMGVDGLYVKMADYQITDGWILEIPPHGSTKPLKHMFESGIYFFGGPGHTMIEQEGRRPQRVEWKYRTLFSIPLNAKYQHFNDSDKPVRLVAVTSFPFIINSTNNIKFAYENPFKFTDRYDAEEDFARKSVHAEKNLTLTNVVPDALEFKLDSYDGRGKGTTNMHWTMSGNTMIDLHVSEIPGGLYKRAHRHSSDAFILLLSGNGYSLTWPEGQYEKRIRVNWHEGTMFVPPIYWYHQHLNPGTESGRYLAINAPNIVTALGLRFQDQIEPDLPEIAKEFDAEMAKLGTAPAKEKKKASGN